MDSNDAAELIAELKEERSGHEAEERFNRGAALMIAVMAAVLAVGGLGGGNATDDMIISNIRASDTWAFYQAKNIRQAAYEIEVAELESRLPGAAPAERAALEARIAEYAATIARYDDEPDPEAPDDPLRGEGKKQLMAQAQAFEATREVAVAKDDNFDLAEVALQLALVLGSVAILATNRAILVASGVLGAIGALLTLNGFLLLFALPF
ncbi:MAG TPA: DUF4337 domain-containing protein [Croceibacterium sp.]|nr:DUF4337 domain-containing protein [Croceibacterium sp.]